MRRWRRELSITSRENENKVEKFCVCAESRSQSSNSLKMCRTVKHVLHRALPSSHWRGWTQGIFGFFFFFT